MPTLNWIGKDAVVKHHKDVPYRLLEPVPELSCGDPASGNLIVQGDNLHALKALLPRYAGQVKCIYIDPPYNTGNEGWVYNDNVRAPEIVKWLGQVVGKEAEDLRACPLNGANGRRAATGADGTTLSQRRERCRVGAARSLLHRL